MILGQNVTSVYPTRRVLLQLVTSLVVFLLQKDNYIDYEYKDHCIHFERMTMMMRTKTIIHCVLASRR